MPDSRRSLAFVAGLFMAASASVAAASAEVEALVRDATVSITQRRTTDAEADRAFPCSNFVRTNREARSFLLNARRISENEAHYDYDVYHCEVSGLVHTARGTMLQFVVRFGGTGWLALPNRDRLLLGCRAHCCKAARSVCG